MTPDEHLERATRELREASTNEQDALVRNRARVLDTVRMAKRRRARALYVAFPIAAVLVGTTAWAASTGRFAAIFFGPTQVAVAPPANAPPPGANPRPPGEKGAPPVESSAPPDEKGAPPVESSAPPVETAPPPVAKPRPSTEDAGSIDLALYQVAHKLHFIDKRYDAAIGAWDEYLRGSPHGAFVVEARYNRAICLVKLGRKAEARVALQPFADGKVAGGYRREEAQKLLDAAVPE